MKTGIGSHTRAVRGATDEWLTPPGLIESLGKFDLDPCAPIVRPWNMAANHFSLEDDGLSLPWTGRVWLNPPYGRQTARWLRKLALHNDGIALTFARTETEAFQHWVWPAAAAVYFLTGRLHFYSLDGRRAKGNAGGPSVLIAYGERNVAALADRVFQRDWKGQFLLVNR